MPRLNLGPTGPLPCGINGCPKSYSHKSGLSLHHKLCHRNVIHNSKFGKFSKKAIQSYNSKRAGLPPPVVTSPSSSSSLSGAKPAISLRSPRRSHQLSPAVMTVDQHGFVCRKAKALALNRLGRDPKPSSSAVKHRARSNRQLPEAKMNLTAEPKSDVNPEVNPEGNLEASSAANQVSNPPPTEQPPPPDSQPSPSKAPSPPPPSPAPDAFPTTPSSKKPELEGGKRFTSSNNDHDDDRDDGIPVTTTRSTTPRREVSPMTRWFSGISAREEAGSSSDEEHPAKDPCVYVQQDPSFLSPTTPLSERPRTSPSWILSSPLTTSPAMAEIGLALGFLSVRPPTTPSKNTSTEDQEDQGGDTLDFTMGGHE